jgi:phosphate uptake regulator
MDSIFKVFEKFDFPEMLEESEEIFKKFLIKYDAIFFNFIDYIHTNKEIDTVEISKAVIIAKNFDRTIDHCMNIIESFSYIE